MALLIVALLTMALLTVALLTMTLLTVALLTVALLTTLWPCSLGALRLLDIEHELDHLAAVDLDAR